MIGSLCAETPKVEDGEKKFNVTIYYYYNRMGHMIYCDNELGAC